MSGGPDLGRIVSLIMENPKLIEEISNLGKSEAEPQRDEPAREETRSESSAAVAEGAPIVKSNARGNRSQLLGALKPYVSKERAQAIDSMLSIVEILDAMKGR